MTPNFGAPSRRKVLLGGLAGAAGITGAAACSADTTGPAQEPSSSPVPTRTADVAIVGAGLAGITTARELVARGRTVVVLEARDRVGGRLLNHDIGGGEITEVGGEYIGPTQDRIAALAKAVGIDTFRTYNEGSNVLLLSGKLSRYPATGLPTDPSVASDLVKLIGTIDGLTKDIPLDAPWTAKRAEEFDSQTFETFLRSQLRNPGARALTDAAIKSIWGAEARDLSLLYVLWYVACAGNESTPGSFSRLVTTADGSQESRFVGGSQLVAIEAARQLGDRVVLTSPVRRIEQTASGVTVTSDRMVVKAARVVVAAPPAVTAFIDWAPLLPARRAQLMQRSPQGSLVKAEAIYATPFWRTAGLSGQAVADTGLARSTFDNSPPSGKPGVLFGFVGGVEARDWNDSSESVRRDAVLRDFAGFFGDKARTPTDYVEKNWSDEEWTRAARSATCHRACCWTTARRFGSRSGGSTGPARRRRPTGAATWTARRAPVSGLQRRSCPPACEAAGSAALRGTGEPGRMVGSTGGAGRMRGWSAHVKLTKRWSWLLVLFGVWSWVLWPTFLRNIAKDDRSFRDGVPQSFFIVHLVLTVVSLAGGTAIGVLGIKGLRGLRKPQKEALDAGSRTSPDRDRAGTTV